MAISREALLEKLQAAYEIEEVMADFLTRLAMPHVLTSKIPAQDRRKVRKMLTLIHEDTLKHKKVVSGMIKRLSEESLGA
jgi:hypothetical protein